MEAGKDVGHRIVNKKSKTILVGKAASGKTHLKERLINCGFKGEISYTTRPKRDNEIHGKDYFFVAEHEFQQMKDNDEFYECQNFNGWWYGTTKEAFFNSDVFIFTPSGVKDIKSEDRVNCFIIFLDIPENIRRERLLLRSDADKVDRRLAADELDFSGFNDYDMIVTNSDF
jgi:guanylate kinase